MGLMHVTLEPVKHQSYRHLEGSRLNGVKCPACQQKGTFQEQRANPGVLDAMQQQCMHAVGHGRTGAASSPAAAQEPWASGRAVLW